MTYDLSADNNAMSIMLENDESHDGSDIKPADNGVTYLTPGEYIIRIAINEAQSEHKLIIK